ncbi:MAG: Flagellar biosynthesis protein FlgA [Klenkia sp.]|nr:Flagellar biosynthesis protein FlgA [Klenkia sp.]
MATGTSTTRDGTAGPLEGPTPRRVRPPRWLDLRLVLGVLLVLGSVVIGARVVTAADATVPVWAASGDLAAGTVLTAEDLEATSVRLDDAASAYLSTTTRPAGQVLGRPVSAGELLPRAALEPGSDLVQLALPVQAGYVPPSLARGHLVDVYAVADPAAGAGVVTGDVDLVVGGAPVQAVSGRGDGVLSTATTTVQVVVAVRADDAQGVLAAIGGRALVVVVRESADGPATATPGAPAPTGTPTPTTAGPTG